MEDSRARLRSEKVAAERRGEERSTALIMAAKLRFDAGELVCIIRDISASGISLRTFHDLPENCKFALVLPDGDPYELSLVRSKEQIYSFTFDKPVDVKELIAATQKFAKRPLRIAVDSSALLTVGDRRYAAKVRNLSQQGALIECDAVLALQQPVLLEISKMPKIEAKVRRKETNGYGLAFDNTFSLPEFAANVAALQFGNTGR